VTEEKKDKEDTASEKTEVATEETAETSKTDVEIKEVTADSDVSVKITEKEELTKLVADLINEMKNVKNELAVLKNPGDEVVDVSVDERDVLDNPNKYTCISDTWGSNNVYRETDFNYNSNFWTNKEKVVVISNDKFIGELEEGDAIVKIMGQVYNLQSLSGDNYATSSIGTCDVDYLTNAATYILEDREEAERKGSMSTNGVVHFDNSISVISGARIIPYTVNIIEYKNTWVYVRAVGELCEIKKADNGDYFADCRDAIYDEEIICRPSTVGCSVDGRTKGEAEGASCSWYSGVPGKTYPDGEDNICKWKCVDGKLEKYDCKNNRIVQEMSIGITKTDVLK